MREFFSILLNSALAVITAALAILYGNDLGLWRIALQLAAVISAGSAIGLLLHFFFYRRKHIAVLSISGPYLLKDRRYKNKNQRRMKVHNAGPATASNVQVKLKSGISEPTDSRWSSDYPYHVYPKDVIVNDPVQINDPKRQINAKDDETYEITCGWQSEAGLFFTTINTKGGGHNEIHIERGERWELGYQVTAENADFLNFILEIFIQDNEVKVVRKH
jgi:hypothetical protein